MRLLLLPLKLPLATNFVLLIFPNFGIFVSLSNSDVINKNAFACKVYCKCAIKQVFKIHFSNSWSPLILGRRSNTSHSNLHDRNLFIRDVIFFHESYALDCISCMQNSKKCWSSIIGQFRCPKNHNNNNKKWFERTLRRWKSVRFQVFESWFLCIVFLIGLDGRCFSSFCLSSSPIFWLGKLDL